MKMTAMVAVLAGAVFAAATQAATITYTLVKDVNSVGAATPGSYAVFASVNTGDNLGLASFTVTVGAAGSTSVNRAPQQTFNAPDPTDPDAPKIVRTAGFTETRQALTAPAASDGFPVATVTFTGNEDTTRPQSTVFVYGFGQTGGDLRTLTPSGFTNTDPANNQVYQPQLLLATGTYTGTTPAILAAAGNVFATERDGSVIGAGVNIVNPSVAIPEPASLAVLAGGVALLSRRRKVA